MSEQRFVFGQGFLEGRQVLARKHQQVDRRLWVNVFDHHRALILMNDFGGELAINDPAEEAIFH